MRLDYGIIHFYQLSLGFARVSVTLLLFKVFGTDRSSMYQLYALLTFIVIYTGTMETVNIVNCIPFKKNWSLDPELPGRCLDIQIPFWTIVACNILTDLWIIAFVVPRVWHLRAPLRQKLGVIATLTMGWLVVIGASMRAGFAAAVFHTHDPTWQSYLPTIWRAVEVNSSLICAAAPALKPLLDRWPPHCVTTLLSILRSTTIRLGSSSQTPPPPTVHMEHARPEIRAPDMPTMPRSGPGRNVTAPERTSNQLDEQACYIRPASGSGPPALQGILKSTHIDIRYTSSPSREEPG
jgi:hypothetical protein